MRHRHLNTTEWTLAAIDSVLERGDLPDWRELFAAVRGDRELARKVLRVVEGHDLGGAGIIARALAVRCWPDLDANGHLRVKAPSHQSPGPERTCPA